MGYVILYISIPPDRRQNVSGSSTISFSPSIPPLPYSPSEYDPPSADTCPALIPMIFRAECYHHLLGGSITGFRSATIHNSMIGRGAMYCATVFWQRAIYIPISSSTTISSAAPKYRPDNVWGPCLPSTVPPVGETPLGNSTTGGSVPMSRTQTGAPIVPPPHITSPLFSYPLPPFPRSSSAVPILPAPSGGSVPPLANCCQWTTTFVPSTGKNIPPSVVYH